MRTYLLVSGDFVKTGGMDRANYALASYLAGRGDEVHLAAFRAGADLLERPGTTLHRVAKPLGSYTLGQPVLDRVGRAWARRIAGRGGRVVVNGGNCRWGDVNWVHHVNVLDTPKPGRVGLRRFKAHLDYRLHVAAERAALGMARLVITTCERNRRDLQETFGIPAGRIAVAYYGTDPEVFHPADPGRRAELRARLGWAADRPVVAFVGALGDRRKGFDTLYAAWSELCRDPGWDADLVVAGAGAELPAWKARAGAEGLAARVRFLGFRRDAPDLFRAADAHVLPSRYEGYSLVTQEALCCGLPAFVTRTAGIAERYPEALHDLLIPDPDDAADLAARLRRWREAAGQPRPELASLSATLRAYTWDDMAARIAGILEETA